MNIPHHLRPFIGCLSVAAAALYLTGCASTSKSTQAPTPVVTSNYELVHVTGSHIPIKVPTDPNVRRVPTTTPTVALTPAQFQSMMDAGAAPIRTDR